MDKVVQIVVLITIPTYFLLPLAGDGAPFWISYRIAHTHAP